MRPTTSEPTMLRAGLGTLLVLLPLIALLSSCASNVEPVEPVAAPGPCAANPRMFPTASDALRRTSPDRAGQPPFAASLVPTVPVPIRIGTELGFLLSSGTAGYASLPRRPDSRREHAAAGREPGIPVGDSRCAPLRRSATNWVILLVTRQPFTGFSGNDTLTSPVETALDERTFVSQLNAATRGLGFSTWAADEVRIRIVA